MSLSIFDSKSLITFCLSLSDLFTDSGIRLINKSDHWYYVFPVIGLTIAISFFSKSSMLIWRGSNGCLGLGLGVGRVLIADLGLDTGLSFEIDADNVVNMLYS